MRLTRQHALGPAGKPGTIKVAALQGGKVSELEGKAALAELPKLLRKPKASVWVDVIAPTPEQAQKVGVALGLHPLIVEDILEGNQRA
ncbi:MAG: hypothetical protein ABI562_05720, partial [Chloroflexota bacterium]